MLCFTLRRLSGHLEVRKRYPVAHSMFKGLFIWWEGAPANRATRLEGLKHSPPLHATRLTGTVNGLSELSFERPLSTTNRHGKTLFSILFQLPARTRACSLPETRLLHWSLQIDCHSVRKITLANSNYEQFTSRRHVFAVYLTSISRDSPARAVCMVKSYLA